MTIDSPRHTHLHYYHRFLDNVAHASSDEVQQYTDASFCGALDADSSLSYRFDALPYKIDVNFRCIPVNITFVTQEAATERILTP